MKRLLRHPYLNFTDYLDNRLSLAAGISITVVLSLVVSLLVSTAIPTGDYWFHYSWLKLTHRKPVADWYDDTEDTYMNFPQLTAYTHYLMGFLVRYMYPKDFNTSNVYGDGDSTETAKWGVRCAFLVVTVLLYYPTVILVVLRILEKSKRSCKLMVIAIFLVMPSFAYVEFGSTQENSGQFGCLLLAFYFFHKENLYLGTVFYTLALFYKQVLVMFLPVTIAFILGNIWQKLNNQSSLRKLLLLFWESVKIASAGVLTLAVTLVPFILTDPVVIPRMFLVMTRMKERFLVNPTASLWMLAKQAIPENIDSEHKGLTYLLTWIPTILAMLALCRMLWRRPTPKNYLVAFSMMGMVMYFIGYSMHEKHIHYMFMSFLLLPNSFGRYFAFAQALSTWVFFPTACTASNTIFMSIYAALFLPPVWLFENQLRNEADRCDQIERAKEKCGFHSAWPVLDWMNQNSWIATRLLMGTMATTVAIYLAIRPIFHYPCYMHGINEELLFFKGCSVAGGWFFLWLWLAGWREISERWELIKQSDRY